ncbi:hypothetical protein CR969_01310 [Candidatus Saccharibacteria bacterium]|nr:MAG: hypothetical protein CR969_01310 [Candidatus Saccharibacteria bacterium]
MNQIFKNIVVDLDELKKLSYGFYKNLVDTDEPLTYSIGARGEEIQVEVSAEEQEDGLIISVAPFYDHKNQSTAESFIVKEIRGGILDFNSQILDLKKLSYDFYKKIALNEGVISYFTKIDGKNEIVDVVPNIGSDKVVVSVFLNRRWTRGGHVFDKEKAF